MAGHGCRKCFDKRNSSERKVSKEDIQKEIYKYNNIENIGEYIDTKHKCLVKCKNCGYVWKTMTSELKRGHGCPKCNTSWNKRRITKKDFISKMNKLYNSEYQYLIDKEYVLMRDFIKFVCPKHGVIEQLVSTHIKGNGCKFCKESSLEKSIRINLINNNINIIPQYKVSWLGLQSLDFYLPEYNIAIECQGRQHFEVVEVFGGEVEHLKVVERDKIKKQLCKENGVKLVYYLTEYFVKYLEEDDIYFTNEEELIKFILSCNKNIVHL